MYFKHIFISAVILAGLMSAVFAQRENKYIRKGNSSFEDKDYAGAETNYFRSLKKADDPHKGLFNLGDVYYERKEYKQASEMFDSVARLPVDPSIRSQAFYNLGNTLLSASIEVDSLAGEALPLSIESYKQALRINPADTAAKYNLAYAQLLLKDQQQNQQQNQQNQQNQDQQQDQQNDQQQDQQNDQQQDQENDQQKDKRENQQQNQQEDQQKGNPEQQQSQSQQQPRQISKEDAERMLEAMKNDEKKTLEKVKLVKMKGKAVKSEKDW
jgi:hypothetical protein